MASPSVRLIRVCCAMLCSNQGMVCGSQFSLRFACWGVCFRCPYFVTLNEWIIAGIDRILAIASWHACAIALQSMMWLQLESVVVSNMSLPWLLSSVLFLLIGLQRYSCCWFYRACTVAFRPTPSLLIRFLLAVSTVFYTSSSFSFGNNIFWTQFVFLGHEIIMLPGFLFNKVMGMR